MSSRNGFTGQLKRIDTGICVFFPRGQDLYGLIVGRSSNTIRGLIVHLGVIDSDYMGSLVVMLQNVSQEAVLVPEKARIAQLIVQPYIRFTHYKVHHEYGPTDGQLELEIGVTNDQESCDICDRSMLLQNMNAMRMVAVNRLPNDSFDKRRLLSFNLQIVTDVVLALLMPTNQSHTRSTFQKKKLINRIVERATVFTRYNYKQPYWVLWRLDQMFRADRLVECVILNHADFLNKQALEFKCCTDISLLHYHL